MTPRTLFKIIIRTIGLILLLNALFDVPGKIIEIMEIRGKLAMAAQGYAQRVTSEQYASLVRYSLNVASGVYLLFFGKWLLARVGPAAGSCGECGYNLAGLPAVAKCPECGTPYGPATMPVVSDAPNARDARPAETFGAGRQDD